MKKRFKCIFALLALFLGCTKEEVTPRVYPRVDTGEAYDITSEGATFKGEIIFSSVEIKDHGFVWSAGTSLQVQYANKISLGTKAGVGSFESRCERSLEPGKKYYVKAYAISEDFTVYGETVEFISLGSKAPVVKDFFPVTGTWGDTITVVGENFSDDNTINKVKFGEATGRVVRSGKDTLMVEVPNNLTMESSNLSVTIFGNVANFPLKAFTLKAPVIESISPMEGAPSSTVTLTGKFFNGSFTKVYFNGVEGIFPTGNHSQVTVRLPISLSPGSVEVKVVTGPGSMFDITSFTVKPPQVLQLSPATAGEGDVIKLIGNFFSTQVTDNIVTFGNINAVVTVATPNELRVIVPPDVNAIEIDVKVKIGNSESAPVTFSFLPPVVESFTPQRGSTGTEVIIKGKNFKTGFYNKAYIGTQELSNVYAISPNELHGYLTEIPTTTHAGKIKVTFLSLEGTSTTDFQLPWIQLNDFPGSPLYHSRTLIYNNKAYVGFGGEPMSNQFWRFDPATRQWNQLSNFPGTQRNAPITFTVGSKGYIGAGEYLKDFWEYNFANDTWVQKSNLPMTGNIGIGFTLNNAGYVTENNTVNTRLWKYNSSTDSWTVASTSPIALFDYTPYFVIGNSVYILGYSEMWKYDAVTNQWASVAQNPDISAGVCFSVGTFGYAIVTGGEMYKFNSLSNTWTTDHYALEYYDVVSALFSIGGKGYLVNYNRILEYEPEP
jgi:N-acetylneuraminic acid mutarotase